MGKKFVEARFASHEALSERFRLKISDSIFGREFEITRKNGRIKAEL
jgi:hypothetical protein